VLVLHRREAAYPTIDVARRVTTDIPDARLALLEGAALVPFLGDTDAVLTAMNEFLSEPDKARPAGLTEREVEVLANIAGGRSNEQMAKSLSISTRTVERHIANVYNKIGAHNRAEATAYALRHGIGDKVPEPAHQQ
jgi:DNA-binding NarL/FixJ family response regulator